MKSNLNKFEKHLKAYVDGELSPLMQWCVRRALKKNKNSELQKELEKMEKITQTVQSATETNTENGDVLPETLREKLRATAPQSAPSSQGGNLPPLTSPKPLRNLVIATGITFATLGLAYVSNIGENNGSGGTGNGISSSIGGLSSAPTATMMYTQDYEDRGSSAGAWEDNLAGRNRAAKSFAYGSANKPSSSPLSLSSAYQGTTSVHREAALEVLVASVLTQSDRAESEIKQRGGRVERGDVTTSKGEKVAAFVMRVPVEKFDDTLKLFSGYGEVIGKHVSSEDLTGQIKSNQKQVEAQANNVKRTNSELKEVERTARDARARIEMMASLREQLAQQQTELDRLSDQAKFATLYLSFKEKRGTVAPPTGVGAELAGAVEAMGKTLRLLLRLPFQFLLSAIAYAPFWIPLAFLWRRALKELK